MREGLDTSALIALPKRPASGHKGTFGRVAIVGGSAGNTRAISAAGDTSSEPTMLGAPALAGLAALRAGCGLCTLVVPQPLVTSTLALCPSAVGVGLPVDASGHLERGESTRVMEAATRSCDALAIGPGLGKSEHVAQLVVRALQREDVAVVIDADAINAMARIPELFRDFRAPAVLTPHPGEFARLAEALGISLDPITPATRPSAAAGLAQRLGCIVVLKGAGTCVSDGHRTWVCARGSPSLATAGTGDVLTGLLASLIGQHVASGGTLARLYDLARLAVEAHACAGEAWANARNATGGMLATELCEQLPSVLEGFRR